MKRIAEDKSRKKEAKASDLHKRRLKREQAQSRRAKQRAEAEKLAQQRERIKRERYELRCEHKSKLREVKLKAARERAEKYKRSLENRGAVINQAVLVRARGNMETTVNSFIKAGIPAYGFKALDNREFTFTIAKKDSLKSFAILSKVCYNYKAEDVKDAAATFSWWLSRLGLVIGLAVFLSVSVLSYGFIWRIDVDGNEILADEAIITMLREYGITAGTRQKKVDAAELEKYLLTCEGIAVSSVKIQGTTLKVYVLESETHQSLKSYALYQSLYDSVVTRVIARSGTPLVKSGDIVKRGAVLIDGTVRSTDGLPLLTVPAEGEVYGRVSFTFSVILNENMSKLTRSGKSKRVTSFELFGLKMFGKKPPYARYESVSSTHCYDAFLPLFVTSATYYELVEQSITTDIDELVQGYTRARLEELEFVSDTFHTVTQLSAVCEGMYKLDLFIEGEMLISEGTV